MPPLTAVAPVPMASIPVVGMSPPLVSSVPTAAVPPLANGAPAVIQPLPAFGHPGKLCYLQYHSSVLSLSFSIILSFDSLFYFCLFLLIIFIVFKKCFCCKLS